MVARIRDPGCKVDTMVVLEGPQGRLKSTVVRTLSAPWFTDELADLGSKDSAQQLQDRWLVELAELSAMHPKQVERTKAFLSRSDDTREAGDAYMTLLEDLIRKRDQYTKRADELMAEGDMDGRAVWHRFERAIDELQRTAPGTVRECIDAAAMALYQATRLDRPHERADG